MCRGGVTHVASATLTCARTACIGARYVARENGPKNTAVTKSAVLAKTLESVCTGRAKCGDANGAGHINTCRSLTVY